MSQGSDKNGNATTAKYNEAIAMCMVTVNSGVFFNASLYKPSNKQSICRWFRTSWHLCDAAVKILFIVMYVRTQKLFHIMASQITGKSTDCSTACAGWWSNKSRGPLTGTIVRESTDHHAWNASLGRPLPHVLKQNCLPNKKVFIVS